MLAIDQFGLLQYLQVVAHQCCLNLRPSEHGFNGHRIPVEHQHYLQPVRFCHGFQGSDY